MEINEPSHHALSAQLALQVADLQGEVASLRSRVAALERSQPAALGHRPALAPSPNTDPAQSLARIQATSYP